MVVPAARPSKSRTVAAPGNAASKAAKSVNAMGIAHAGPGADASSTRQAMTDAGERLAGCERPALLTVPLVFFSVREPPGGLQKLCQRLKPARVAGACSAVEADAAICL